MILLAAASVGATRVLLGSDRFWREVLALFRTCERLWPEPARKLRLRAALIRRKWHRLLAHLPGPLADRLHLPDLRALSRADLRHDAALAARLGRLAGDRTY